MINVYKNFTMNRETFLQKSWNLRIFSMVIHEVLYIEGFYCRLRFGLILVLCIIKGTIYCSTFL